MSRKFMSWMAFGVFAVAVAGFGGTVSGGHDYDDDDDGCCRPRRCCKPVKVKCCRPVKVRCCRPVRVQCCKPAPTCCKPAPRCCAPAPRCHGGSGAGSVAPPKAPQVPKGDDKPPAPGKSKSKKKA